MASDRFVLWRKVVGLRPIASAVVFVLGALAPFAFPCLVGTAVGLLTRAVGLPPVVVQCAGALTFILQWPVILFLLVRGLEACVELRVPWGRVAIGPEGVRWDDRWLRSRLTPWRDVREIITERDAVIVVTHAGARIVHGTSDAAALRDSIRAARARRHTAVRRAEIPDALICGRDTTRWIAHARKLLARDSYRDGWLPPRVLVRVLEDPEAPAAARAGAAAALLPSDPAERERIARVRNASVDVDFALVLDDLLAERIVPARWARLAQRA